MARKKLGELLLERKMVSVDQLNAALAHQRQYGKRLGASLVALGLVREDALAQVLGDSLALPVVDLSRKPPEPDAVQLLRPRFCETNELFPIALAGTRGRKELTVAMADPMNLPAIEEIEFTTGCKVRTVLATRSQILRAILRHYHNHAPGLSSGGRMEIEHAGGVTMIADDQLEELEILEGEPVQEVTERTALAELIREREAQRRAARGKKSGGKGTLTGDLGFLMGVDPEPDDRLEKLERRFWALMRILAKKGHITRDEFLQQLDDG